MQKHYSSEVLQKVLGFWQIKLPWKGFVISCVYPRGHQEISTETHVPPSSADLPCWKELAANTVNVADFRLQESKSVPPSQHSFKHMWLTVLFLFLVCLTMKAGRQGEYKQFP